MKLIELLGYFNYWVFAIILSLGLYAVISKTNLIKKLIGLLKMRQMPCVLDGDYC